MGSALTVDELVGVALFQDLGRTMIAAGVPLGGAFDRSAQVRANTLLGNEPPAATLEVVGSIKLRASGPLLVTVTGLARVSAASGGASQQMPTEMALELLPGSAIEVQAPRRCTVAVRGGFQVRAVLGSRSTSLLGPLGPAPVRAGDRIAVGGHASDTLDARAGDYAIVTPSIGPVAVVAGPHGSLRSAHVEVLDASRIGVRLRAVDSDGLAESAVTDLRSHGVLPGALQMLPNGDWMLLGPDAGTMGGYPVIGVLAADGLDRWAHVVAGQAIDLRAVPRGSTAPAPPARIVRVGHLG